MNGRVENLNLRPEETAVNGAELALVQDPGKVLENAQRVAKVLMAVIEEKELYLQIGERRHIENEAWLLLAHFYGVTPRVVTVEPVLDDMTGAAGFEACCEAIHVASGRVLGRAFARCLNNEDNWSMRPKYRKDSRDPIGEVRVPSYQLESMAQTRASSKVLASLFRFVVVLGGMDGTPADEMDDNQGGGGKGQQSQTTQRAEPITEGQRKRIFAIAKECNVPYEKLGDFWGKHGFKLAADITRDKYDAIVAEIQQASGKK